MLTKLKQLFCIHDYKSKKTFYCCSADHYGNYNLYLYEYKKCTKCGKERIKNIHIFKFLFRDDVQKIKKMLENHGAISYFQFIGERIKENG